VDIYGNAKNVHDGTNRERRPAKHQQTHQQQPLLSRTQPPPKGTDEAAKGSRRTGGTAGSASDAPPIDRSTVTADEEQMKQLLAKVAKSAGHAIETNIIRSLHVSKPRLVSKDFRLLLLQLKVSLSEREMEALEMRYIHQQSGLVDIPAFRADFKALGTAYLQERKQREARASFIRALSRNEDRTSSSASAMEEHVSVPGDRGDVVDGKQGEDNMSYYDVGWL